MKLDTLAKTYERRNHGLGRRANLAADGIDDDAAFAAMERAYAKQGPLPKAGFRTARWEGM